MNPLVHPWRGTRMKLEKKWQLASCSVGMLSQGEMLLEEPSLLGERANSRAMGESDSSESSEHVVEGELTALPLSDLASTEALRPPSFCARRSVALVSLRKTRSNSSL